MDSYGCLTNTQQKNSETTDYGMTKHLSKVNPQ